MIRWGLCLCIVSVLLTEFSALACLSDFNQPQRNLPHNLAPSVLEKLLALSELNQPKEGWQLLATHGDRYAKLAQKVLGSDSVPFLKNHLQILIESHWKNAVGPRVYRTYFKKVAALHFKQYVKILLNHQWPDSDQVINSYLNAVRTFRLPDVLVFDAAWEAAGYNHLKTWQELNHLTPDRSVYPSQACYDIETFYSQLLLSQDFLTIPIDMVLTGPSEEK